MFLFSCYFLSGNMFEAIQYSMSSKKLEDEFGMDKVVLVYGRGKITRLCDNNMGLDLQFIHNNIARVTQYFEQLLWARNKPN